MHDSIFGSADRLDFDLICTCELTVWNELTSSQISQKGQVILLTEIQCVCAELWCADLKQNEGQVLCENCGLFIIFFPVFCFYFSCFLCFYLQTVGSFDSDLSNYVVHAKLACSITHQKIWLIWDNHAEPGQREKKLNTIFKLGMIHSDLELTPTSQSHLPVLCSVGWRCRVRRPEERPPPHAPASWLQQHEADH